jgi:uncharacterized membrane protein YgcG
MPIEMRKTVVVILFLTIILVGAILSSCQKEGYEYPRPSADFYVNDFADALLPGSRQSFFTEGVRLYDETKDTDLGGAQFVVTTMLVANEGEIASIDKTELFRQWQIGENDMGLLLLLLFTGNEEEKTLVSTQAEIGYRMEAYLTAAEVGNLIDSCLFNPEWEGSLDMGLGELYYELISRIYIRAYEYESFNYDMEVYRDYLITAEDMPAQSPMTFMSYIFSSHTSLWTKIILGVVIFLITGLLGGGGLFAVKHRGGGGSSGGYGIKR